MSGILTPFGETAIAPFTPTAGWSFAYNINSDIATATTDGGTVTHVDNQATLSTGAAAEQSAKLETVRTLRYIPGQGGRARFTAVFTPGVEGSQQIIGIGDDVDGFFFGYNGAQFGTLVRRDGEDTWTPASAWNSRQVAQSSRRLNPTLGNVYQIAYQWLGFGAIFFYIEEPLTGELDLVHVVQYANTTTATSIKNPNLPIMAEVANTTNETDITLGTPSAVGGVDGYIFGPDPIHPFSFFRTAVATKTGITTQAAVLTLANAAEFQGIQNRVRLRLTALSVATDGTKNVTVRLVKNTTLGGTPSFTAYNAGTSPASTDTAGTTLTGGVLLASFALAKADSRTVDLEPFGIELAPGTQLTVSATSSGATEITAGLTWADLF